MSPIRRTLTTLLILALSVPTILAQIDSIFPDGGDSEVMRRQANVFIRSHASRIQQDQARAIAMSLIGENGRLNSIRESRNAAPQLPVGVVVKTPAPNMRLYQRFDADTTRLPLLVYLHGGGWTFGSINSCARFCATMAATGRVRVLAVDYRLAPEHPYPAGLNDCVAAIEYALSNFEALSITPGGVFVGGDSAGGNLALAAAMRPELSGQIDGLILFYPVTKAFSDGSASWREFGSGYALDSELMSQFNMAYTYRSGATPADPLISVGLAPDSMLSTLPPTLLVAAGRDILRDQGRELAERLPDKITRVELSQAAHLFITVPGQDEAFLTAVILASDFINSLL